MILNNLSILPFYKVTDENPSPRECEKWWVYGNVFPLITPGVPPIQVRGVMTRCALYPYYPNGEGGPSFAAPAVKTIEMQQYSWQSERILSRMGRYYIQTTIDGITAVSDVFTIVRDTTPYLKLEWWDDNDFVMDAGAIVYTNAGVNVYKNVLYLATDLAKPDYNFTEEGENRDGYFFPIKQISSKRYRFTIFAPEYLLDVMRLIRMSDHIQITYRGQVFTADTFLMTPTWESNGDLASVVCEFETDTVAKKIGRLVTI